MADTQRQTPAKFYGKRFRKASLFVGSLVFMVIGILFIMRPDLIAASVFSATWHVSPSYILTIGWASILFFGLGSFVLAPMLFRPAVVIDSMGIIDNASGIDAGRIPWSNIQEVKPIDFMGYAYVGIVPVDNQLVLNSVNFIKRKLLPLHLKSGAPLVIIPAEILGIEASQIIEEAKLRRPAN